MARHPLIGYFVWALLFGALFAWEGLALTLQVRRRADAQRHVPGDHALPIRAVGAVRAVAVARLAFLRPRLALPAPRLTAA